MGVVGTLLKNRRAGEAKLAWNLPNLSAPETLVLTSDAFADAEAILAEHGDRGAAAGHRGHRAALLLWTSRRAGSSLEHAAHP